MIIKARAQQASTSVQAFHLSHLLILRSTGAQETFDVEEQ
jgi:hypothetical protein